MSFSRRKHLAIQGMAKDDNKEKPCFYCFEADMNTSQMATAKTPSVFESLQMIKQKNST